MIHPETGEVLETREQLRAAINLIEQELQKRTWTLYRTREALRDGLAEFEPVLPTARARTPTQDRVARCPRCGSKLKDGNSDVGFGEVTEE